MTDHTTVEVDLVFLAYNPRSLLVRRPDRVGGVVIAFSLIDGGRPGGLTYGDKIKIRIAKWIAEKEKLL